MASTLARTAARGALATLSAQGIRVVLQLLSVVVLARLLTPHDYGLIAVVLVLVGLGELLRDFGLTAASIQAPELSRGQRDTLFWINAGIGLVLAGLLLAAAAPLAALTGEPAMGPIAQWLSLALVLSGLATQHRASLMRDLRLSALAVIDVASAAIALAAAIAFAALEGSYWALVLQQLVAAGVMLVGVVAAGRWIPRPPSRRHDVRALVGFGGRLVAAGLVQYAAKQVDTVLVSARFGTAAVGLYDRAQHVVLTPLAQVRSPLQSVALPVLARVQRDQPRFEAYVTAAQLALGYLIGLPIAMLAGLAEPIVAIMLGDRWMPAAPLLRMFAIAGLLSTLSFVGYWVYLARGLGAELLRYTLVTSALRIASIAIGACFGLVGVAVAIAVHAAIAWPISIGWLSRITPMPTRRLYGGAGRVLLVAALGGLAAWAVGTAAVDTGAWAQAGLGVLAGIVPAAAALSLAAYRRDARSLAGFVRLMARRREREPAPR